MDSLLVVLAQASSGEGFNWNSFLGSPAVLFVLIPMLIGSVIATTAIVVTNLRGYHETKQLNELKSDMLQRGFTPDEIARVIESGAGPRSSSSK